MLLLCYNNFVYCWCDFLGRGRTNIKWVSSHDPGFKHAMHAGSEDVFFPLALDKLHGLVSHAQMDFGGLQHTLYTHINLACKMCVWLLWQLLYRICEKFRWIKISPGSATFVLQKMFEDSKNFHQCSQSHHILHVIFNTGQKFSVIKCLPMRASGKNFYVYGYP